jgi:hypothetical protein
MSKKMSVFLGGTCAGSTWRDELVEKLDTSKIDAFNPVVDNWTEECQKVEDYHKENDDVMLFVLTPESKSIYSWVEVTMACLKQPERTVLCVLEQRDGKEYEGHEKKAVMKSVKDLKNNGATVVGNLDDLAQYLNTRANTPKR